MTDKKFDLAPLGQIIWEDRYALKDEVGKALEKDIFETFRRSAKANASKEKSQKKWEDAFYSLMANRYFCPAGRILAHSGTHYQQLLNCFVLPFENDSLESIMDTAKKMAITQKFGGGCGFNYSKLRPSGSYIKGVNGHSCGVLGFINMMSVISEVIEQGGSRRGANLGLLEIWHPDVWDFISYKNEHNWDRLKDIVDVKDEEKWAYFKFDNLYKLQMYNISIGVTDEFFDALKKDTVWPLIWKDKEWELYTVTFRKDNKDGTYKDKIFEVTADCNETAMWKVRRQVPYPKSSDKFEVSSRRRVKASEIWDRICYNAWADGCPGIINLSTARRMHNIEYATPIEASNPCLAGDTLVAVADGRVAVSIKELAKEDRDVPVYCRGDKGKIAIRMLRHPRITGQNQKLLKINIEGNHFIRVTETHKLVLSNGSIIQAKDLKVGDSLSIMNRLMAPFDYVIKHNKASQSNDYYWINSTENNSWILEHRFIYKHSYTIDSKEIVHHKDLNSLNNAIENLEKLTKHDHDALHAGDRIGDNNPMCRAQTEWSDDKWKKYHDNMSRAVSGDLNGRFSGISNEKLFDIAVDLTRSVGHKLSVQDWNAYALEKNYPSQFSQYRINIFGTVCEFLDKAAVVACVPGTGLHHAQLREFKRFLKLKEETDLNVFFDNGIKVLKKCENCGEPFTVSYHRREQGFCSLKCSSIQSASSLEIKNRQIQGKEKWREQKRIQQITIFNDLRLKLGHIPMKKEYAVYCKTQGIPFRLPVKKEVSSGKLIGTFHSWSELTEKALQYNHRVLSIIEDGFETVYNGTVDDYHNFFVGHFEEQIEGHRNFVYINNMQCGEQLLPSNGSCNLGSQILPSFVKDGKIDYVTLKTAVHHSIRFLDDVLDNCEYPLPEIKEIATQYRRIGLGTMGVHDMLIELKLGYDTEEGRNKVSEVLQFIRDESYRASIELAKEKGPFPGYVKDKYLESGFIKTLPEDIIEDIKKYGVRNATTTSQAPTGTIGTMYNVSTGCEPWFALSIQRNTRLGSYEDGCPAYVVWKKDNEGKEKPSYFKTSQEISPEDHIKMMIIFTKNVDSSVSKTINLPNSATVEDVKKAFIMAMENGVKGITVFRDGSKTGVLISKDEKKKPDVIAPQEIIKENTEEHDEITDSRQGPRKRGNRTMGATTRIHMQNHNLYVTVNRNSNNDLVEVFTTVGENKKKGTHHTSGVEDSWAEGLGKTISLALRAGVQPESIITNLKNIPSDKPAFATIGDCENSELISSPPHAIARVMEEEMKYSINGTKKREDFSNKGGNCSECGSTNIKWKSPTCYDCGDCGHSGCGN